MKFISCDNGPNFRKKDIWIALTTLLRNNTNALKNAKAVLDSRFGRPVLLYDSGRSALTHILKAFELPQDSEVIIQAYSCIVVPNSVLQAGLKPIITDVDSSLNINPLGVEELISSNTKAVIVQHNFGNPADMKSIQDLCSKHDLLLIEDCAHSLGATYTIEDELVECGMRGDAALLSFGRDKCVSSVVGGAGMIHPKHASVSQRFERLHAEAPTIRTSLAIKALLYPILVNGLVVPLYHIIIGKAVMYLLRKFNLLPSIYSQSEKTRDVKNLKQPSKIHPLLGSLLKNQLESLDSFVSHRLNITKIYNAELGQNNSTVPYMRYPLILEELASTKSIDSLKSEIKQKARREGIFLGNWYTQLFVDNKGEEYISNDLVPNASKYRGTVLNLPTNIRTSPLVAKKIVAIVQSSM